MHDIEMPAKNSMHKMESLVAPLTQQSHIFFQAPFSINLMFLIIKNNDKLQRMTIQFVQNKIFYMLIFEWTN